MNTLTIHSNIHDYKVYFEENLHFLQKLIEIPNSAFMIDATIFELYKEVLQNDQNRKSFYL